MFKIKTLYESDNFESIASNLKVFVRSVHENKLHVIKVRLV